MYVVLALHREFHFVPTTLVPVLDIRLSSSSSQSSPSFPLHHYPGFLLFLPPPPSPLGGELLPSPFPQLDCSSVEYLSMRGEREKKGDKVRVKSYHVQNIAHCCILVTIIGSGKKLFSLKFMVMQDSPIVLPPTSRSKSTHMHIGLLY